MIFDIKNAQLFTNVFIVRSLSLRVQSFNIFQESHLRCPFPIIFFAATQVSEPVSYTHLRKIFVPSLVEIGPVV